MLADLRPRSATEIVDVSIQLFRRHAKHLLIISAIITIPQLLIGIAMSFTMSPIDATLPDGQLAGEMGGLFLFSIVAVAWLVVGFAALVDSASAAYLTDVPTEPAPALRKAVGRTWRLLMANFLGYMRALIAATLVTMVVGVPLAIGAALVTETSPVFVGLFTIVLLLVAMVIFCAELGRALLVTPMVILEDRGIFDSLRRSRRLSSGFVLRVAMLVFITSVVYFALVVGVMLAGEFLLGTVVAQVLSSLVFLPLYPAIACLTVVLYYDLKVRKEGMDMELLAADALEVPA